MNGARRALAAFGALACAAAVMLGAYASHGLEADAAKRAGIAALFAFGHGLALRVLAPGSRGRTGLAGLSALALGLVLFCGSLAAAALFGTTAAAAAPAGGLALMLGWLLLAAAALQREATP